jgi:hypothetical protein
MAFPSDPTQATTRVLVPMPQFSLHTPQAPLYQANEGHRSLSAAEPMTVTSKEIGLSDGFEPVTATKIVTGTYLQLLMAAVLLEARAGDAPPPPTSPLRAVGRVSWAKTML